MSDIILKGEKRESIAVLNQQLLEKEPDTLDAVELQQEIQGDSYLPQLYAALERGTKKYPSDFYIVCINQRFRLFELVNRTFFIDRLSCPTPDFDQSVYKYTKKDDRLEFLWSIPDQQTCESYRLDPLGVPESHHEQRGYVLSMYDGTLEQKVRKLNKEEEADLVLIS